MGVEELEREEELARQRLAISRHATILAVQAIAEIASSNPGIHNVFDELREKLIDAAAFAHELEETMRRQHGIARARLDIARLDANLRKQAA